MIKEVKADLKSHASPAKAKVLAGYFKTGKGEYGEGDTFLGVTVPKTRKVAKTYAKMPLAEIEQLLKSPVHEERLCSLLILVERYKKYPLETVKFYLKNTKNINNWDLVDTSAPTILGSYLVKHPNEKPILFQLASSENLWEKRIAIIATLAFIRANQFEETFAIAEKHLKDPHDLIHKATGWMLREVGKRDQAAEEKFLKKHHKIMPRTMLRYAIERFPENKRKLYMKF